MKNTKSTKRALLSAILALVMTVSMLVGTTFAWFTDSVTSSGNKIVAGNLDVELYLFDGTDYANISDSQYPIFGAEGEGGLAAAADGSSSLWEPGKTQVAYLAIKNAGNLALKYQVSLIVNEITKSLNDVLSFTITPDIDARVGKLTEWDGTGARGVIEGEQIVSASDVALEAGAIHYFALSVHMDELAGNEYMKGSITFDIAVLAAQLAFEGDSFGNDYDEKAPYPVDYDYEVKDVVEFETALATAQAGETIFMNSGKYNLSSSLTIPSGVSIYGVQTGNAAASWANNPLAPKTVINAESVSGNGIFNILQPTADEVVSDVVIDGVYIDCEGVAKNGIYSKKSGGAAMQGITVQNCAVVNATNNGINLVNTCGAVIENNYVSGTIDTGIQLESFNGSVSTPAATSYIRNNVIENIASTVNGAIRVTSGVGDVVVSGNIIRNIGGASDKSAAITVNEVYEGGVITIENNSIEECYGGISIYKFASVAEEDGVVISGNTIKNCSDFVILVYQPNYKKKSAITKIDIIGNVITTNGTMDAVVVSGGASYPRWQVNATGNTVNGADGGNGSWSAS